MRSTARIMFFFYLFIHNSFYFTGIENDFFFSMNGRSSSHMHLQTLILTGIGVILCVMVSGAGSRNVATLLEDSWSTYETKHDLISTAFLLYMSG